MLLINLPSQTAFNVMRNILDRHCMRSFYGGEQSKDDVSDPMRKKYTFLITEVSR